MNRKQIKDVTNFLTKLEISFGLEKYRYDIDYNTTEVFLPFPNDEDELNSYDVEEIKLYYDQVDSIKIINNFTVISECITQKVIETSKNLYYYLYVGYYERSLENGIRLRIRDSPLLIGLAALKTEQFNII